MTFEDKKDALYLFPILAKGKPVEYALVYSIELSFSKLFFIRYLCHSYLSYSLLKPFSLTLTSKGYFGQYRQDQTPFSYVSLEERTNSRVGALLPLTTRAGVKLLY